MITHLLLLLALVLASCSADDPSARRDSGVVARLPRGDSPPSSRDELARDSSLVQIPRPKTRRDTISIEGDRHVVNLTLHDAGIFSTYYPADEMKAEEYASGEGIAVRFTAAFGGVRNDSAFLHVFVPNDVRSDYRAMRDFLVRPDGLARSNGWTLGTSRVDGPRPCQGAVLSYPITARSGPVRSVGFACIGEYRGRGFIVIAVYPEEYEEGMGPRIESIMDHFAWSDGGALFARAPQAHRPLEQKQ